MDLFFFPFSSSFRLQTFSFPPPSRKFITSCSIPWCISRFTIIIWGEGCNWRWRVIKGESWCFFKETKQIEDEASPSYQGLHYTSSQLFWSHCYLGCMRSPHEICPLYRFPNKNFCWRSDTLFFRRDLSSLWDP